MEENMKAEYLAEDTEADAVALSLEFLRDSRRYCRMLTSEVEE